MGSVTIGVDIGQRVDPSAIVVSETERRRRDDGRKNVTHFQIRHVERLPLGTDMLVVAQRVAEVAGNLKRRSHRRPMCFFDATGAASFVDLLYACDVRAKLVPVTFTHGDQRRVVTGPISRRLELRLGKANLVSYLQSLFQTGCLHLPNSAEARALRDELIAYEIRIDEDADDRYGAFRVGTHDDLATALGLAVQKPVRTVPRGYLVQGIARRQPPPMTGNLLTLADPSYQHVGTRSDGTSRRYPDASDDLARLANEIRSGLRKGGS